MKRIGDEEIVNLASLQSGGSLSCQKVSFEFALNDHCGKLTWRILPVSANDEGSFEELEERKEVAEDLGIQR